MNAPPAKTRERRLGSELRSDRLLAVLLVICLIVGVALRIYGIGAWDLLGDEQIMYHDATENPSKRGIFSAYYFVTRSSLSVIDSPILGVRLPAVLVGLITLPIFLLLAVRVYGPSTAIFAIALLGLSVWHVENSQYARYYSTVFLFSAMHYLLFLRFLEDTRARFFIASIASGAIAVLSHFIAILLFIPTGAFSLLALLRPSYLPSPRARRTLVVGSTVLIALAILALGALGPGVFRRWAASPSWGSHGWAMIPLLATNKLQIATFVAAIVGLFALASQSKKPQFLIPLLGISTALFSLGFLGPLVNMTPQYVFSLAPLFFISAGAVCAVTYGALRKTSWVVALTPFLLIVASSLPSLASYYIERRAISPTQAIEFILDHAQPGDLLAGNVRTPLAPVDSLEIQRHPVPPWESSSEWLTFLGQLENSGENVWLAWDVPRAGLAPELRAWLFQNCDLVYEQNARRIDRQARTLTVWTYPGRGSQ